MKYWQWLFSKSGLILLGFVATVQVGSAVAQNYTVKLNPNAPGAVLASAAQGHNAAGKGNGWVGYGVDEWGWTTFKIVGQQPGKSCADYNGTPPNPWVITKIELSDTGIESTQKGDNFKTPVGDSVWLSFPFVDRTNGLLFEGTAANSPSYLHVFNYNAHDKNDGEKLVYYKLELTPCGGGASITVDPAWGNRGR